MNNQEKLFQLAKAALKNSYSPYSGLKVGAAVLSTNGNFYACCNVESISFPCGTCAEAGAISDMISKGDKKIAEILVMSDSKNLITPCGACLQRIFEFATIKTIVHLADLKGIQKSFTIKELLPKAFWEKELRKKK